MGEPVLSEHPVLFEINLLNETRVGFSLWSNQGTESEPGRAIRHWLRRIVGRWWVIAHCGAHTRGGWPDLPPVAGERIYIYNHAQRWKTPATSTSRSPLKTRPLPTALSRVLTRLWKLNISWYDNDNVPLYYWSCGVAEFYLIQLFRARLNSWHTNKRF